jgi:hypothetical protein
VTQDKKVADYKGIFEELEKKGAISISKKGYSLVFPRGLELLGESLGNQDFRFEGTIVGAWTANALLKWINEINSSPDSALVLKNGGKSAIASYEAFKKIVIEVYCQLNRDHNLNDLVPIYQIRREVGDRVSREHFTTWLLEMQVDNTLQLMAGEMRDITPDKREDSIIIPEGGLRYYAKLLNS